MKDNGVDVGIAWDGILIAVSCYDEGNFIEGYGIYHTVLRGIYFSS